jgi:hypothetical protein
LIPNDGYSTLRCDFSVGISMAVRVILDSMIPRADFATNVPSDLGVDSVPSQTVANLKKTEMFGSMLRKPDFQRETNFWNPEQVVSFLESYLDNELVPAAILWRSSAFVFVIDGAHRLSALRAWMEDDYGDGPISRDFFNGEIPQNQKKAAERTRKMVSDAIGTYAHLREIMLNDVQVASEQQKARARNISTRAFTFQWVVGNADKAESSFFKINTQGTALDPVEEKLLKNRNKSAAIASRSIVRAATGHKYWSSFSAETVVEITEIAKRVHKLLLTPEVETPIKTLDLPVSGVKSTIDALENIIEMLSIANPIITDGKVRQPKRLDEFPDDPDGHETLELLKKFERMLGWIVGADAKSLGLHPAVYYYSERGRHIPVLLFGVFAYICEQVLVHNAQGLKAFTEARQLLEETLVSKKSFILQVLQLTQSKHRAERVNFLIKSLVQSKGALTDEEIVHAIAPHNASKIIALSDSGEGSPAGTRFSADTKSAIALKESLANALRCGICGGYLDPTRSVSFDHIVRVSEGGVGTIQNGQRVHPYCNSAVKG